MQAEIACFPAKGFVRHCFFPQFAVTPGPVGGLFIKFNYTRPIDGLYEMNLSKFLEAAESKKDQILFGRCLEDNKADADFMIVPLGDTIEKLRSKFEEKK